MVRPLAEPPPHVGGGTVWQRPNCSWQGDWPCGSGSPQWSSLVWTIVSTVCSMQFTDIKSAEEQNTYLHRTSHSMSSRGSCRTSDYHLRCICHTWPTHHSWRHSPCHSSLGRNRICHYRRSSCHELSVNSHLLSCARRLTSCLDMVQRQSRSRHALGLSNLVSCRVKKAKRRLNHD